jgi:hypothetical protein
MPEAPIAARRINGRPCILGPAQQINAALRGAAPLEIGHGHAAGETVWLAPRTDQIWGDDAVTIKDTDIADTLHHPVHGEILAAYADLTRLGPIMASIEQRYQEKMAAAERALDARIATTIPTCHNCGDCPECC